MSYVPIMRAMHKCDDQLCVLPRMHEGECDFKASVSILYVNGKGNIRGFRLSPVGGLIHTEAGWAIDAIDHEDGKYRMFLQARIREWKET